MSSPALHLPLSTEEIRRLTDRGVYLDDGKVSLLEHPDAFLAYYFRDKLLPFKDFHLRLIENALVPNRSLILYPATHGKTTIVSTCLPIYALARNPDIRIGAILKNEDDAKAVGLSIMAELEGNDELIDDFGPFKPSKGSTKRWTQASMEVEHRRLRHPRPTIQLYGSGGNVFGHRTDWTIADDVVTNKNSMTEEQRANLREWFNLGVATMPEEEDDRLTVVGTRFHPADLYGDIIELRHPVSDKPIYVVQHEDAIVDTEKQIPLWPERWPWERLMSQKAAVGTLDFNRRYRNRAVDPERMIFREEYVRGGYIGTDKYPGCLDRKHTIGDVSMCTRLGGGHDPAAGIQKGHSFVAHIVLGQGSCERHERCWWVIDMERDTMTAPRQADFIIERHLDYDLQVTTVETNGFQLGLNQFVKERMERRGIALKIEPHNTNTNKIDPEVGVESLGPIVEAGMLHIPYGDEASRILMRQLIHELEEYPGKTTDCVMALWLAYRGLSQSLPRYQSFNRLKQPGVQIGQRFVGFGRRYVPNPYYEGDAVVAET